MLFRLILWALILYFAYRVIKSLLIESKQKPQTKVKGSPRSDDPLDLRDADIEDAKFRDLDKDASKRR